MGLTGEKLTKRFYREMKDSNQFTAVDSVDLSLEKGKLTVLTGRSGSGKTTVLNMLSGLLVPTEGRVLLDDKDIYSLSDKELSKLRNASIGVVPQARSVLDTLTVKENILLPSLLYGTEDRSEEAAHWMDTLHIDGLADSRASELSGGELRRTAIARTLCMHPPVILADEPTGDLDDENTQLVFGCFRKAAEEGAAVLIVSHEIDALNNADVAFRMDGGQLSTLS